MTTPVGESRRTAILVNIAKLSLLAALTPPVVAGIAQRADGFGSGLDTAALVAATVSAGSVCAVLGALGFGALADLGRHGVVGRWCWVLVATIIGTVGLTTLAAGSSPTAMIVGWCAAQLGYSGAMAVLRAILATALPTHRRRGGVVVVLGSYGGMILPLVILLLFPGHIWETTFGLAVLSLAVPLAFLAGRRRGRRADSELGLGDEPETSAGGVAGEPALPRWLLLVVQCAANIVLTTFLSYQALELAARSTESTVFPVRAVVWVVGVALLGLMGAATVLLARPSVLAHSRRLVAAAGVVLALSLVIRGLGDSYALVLIGATLSGIAVGVNSSALFAAALDAARAARGGRFMGAYSAAGALGQFIGPGIALGILALTDTWPIPGITDEGGYRSLFVIIAVVPVLWAVSAHVPRRTRQRSDSRPAAASSTTPQRR